MLLTTQPCYESVINLILDWVAEIAYWDNALLFAKAFGNRKKFMEVGKRRRQLFHEVVAYFTVLSRLPLTPAELTAAADELKLVVYAPVNANVRQIARCAISELMTNAGNATI